jgi:hypothetical protein
MANEKNGSAARKDLAPVLAAHQALQEAESAANRARLALSAASEAFVKAHGTAVERDVIFGEGPDAKTVKVKTYKMKPLPEGGIIYEIRARFSKGSTAPTYVLTARDTM